MKRAQTIIEYAVLIACLVGALIAMQIYIKRGAQGRLRQAADELGQQYAPKNTQLDTTTKYESNTETKVETEEVDEKLKTTTTVNMIKDEQTRSGTETVGGLDASLF